MGRMLLVGEDHDTESLRSHSQLEEHERQTCDGPLEAVRFLRAHAVDVVVSDPATSISEDLALVEEIRAVRPGVRIVVLAPRLTDSDVVKALRAQVFACFTPPFDWNEVAEMVRSAIADSHWRPAIDVVSGLPNWITLRVSCGLVTADRLTRFMTEWRGDLPSGDRDLLMTAFREMLLNAMEHGAGFDPERVIDVTAARTARAIVFHFRDPGEGFDTADLQHAATSNDPDAVFAATVHRADAGLRPGGFGMLIVRQVVDELVYNEKGNEVIMIKHLS
ncbi:MAG TPA: ATP-binding protein [Vicinamibacterales bacterium]|nr:ATP-binding protein [Vicinamibacterales bacterium]